MAGACAPRWRRILRRVIPSLFKQCPDKNYHWCWDRLCYCRVCEHNGDWEGGVLDFRTGEELIPREYAESRVTEWKQRWLVEESSTYKLEPPLTRVFVISTVACPDPKEVNAGRFYLDREEAYDVCAELNNVSTRNDYRVFRALVSGGLGDTDDES